jgi:predicted patatin/cPLA2 family phospholipase
MPPRSLTLVIEGGGLRGAFCAGVLSELESPLRGLVARLYGASAGAPSAAYFATGQIQRAIQIWGDHTHADELVSPKHWLKGRPLMDIDKLVDHFRFGDALAVDRLPAATSEVHVAVTNCNTGEADYLKLDARNAFDVLTATMALPLAYGRVVTVNGTPYVDGGVSDSIPIEQALASGADDILVIQTRPEPYRKQRSKLAEAVFGAQFGRTYPLLLEAFRSRAARYNACVERLTELERSGRISVIRPERPLPASRLTRDRARILATIEVGRASARAWCARNGHTL